MHGYNEAIITLCLHTAVCKSLYSLQQRVCGDRPISERTVVAHSRMYLEITTSVCLMLFMVEAGSNGPITQHGSNPWHGAKWNSDFRMTTLILILNCIQVTVFSGFTAGLVFHKFFSFFLLQVGFFKVKNSSVC